MPKQSRNHMQVLATVPGHGQILDAHPCSNIPNSAGSPPKRLAGDDDDNITELMHKMGVKDVRDVRKSQVQKRQQAAELEASDLPVKDTIGARDS